MLVFVIPYMFPNKVRKGSGVFIEDQVTELAKRGNTVVVLNCVILNHSHFNEAYLAKQDIEIVNGVTIYSCYVRGIMTSRFPHYALNSYLRYVDIMYNKAIETYGVPKLVHAHCAFPSGYVACLLSKKYGVPYVVTEHSSILLNRRINPYIVRALNETMKQAKGFVCVSQSLDRKVRALVGNKYETFVIPNMVNNQFCYWPINDNKTFIFFSAANLVRNKNIYMLVKAFIYAFSKNDNVVLAIAGSGVEKNRIQKLIDKSNRTSQIMLLGYLGRDDILKWLKKCKVFVLASKSETFGLAYREAMAVGRPIISSKNGGIEDNWENSFGILLEQNNIESLLHALRNIKEQYSDYDQQYISQKCKELYSSDRICCALEKVYHSAIGL